MANNERTIVPAKAEHIPVIASNPGWVEQFECWALEYQTVGEALERGLARSTHCWTGMHGGVPVIMFGVCPLTILSDSGLVWGLASRGIADVPMSVVRRAKPYIEIMQAEYRQLVNWVPADAIGTIRWLMFLGFEVGPPERVGPEQALFRGFRWYSAGDETAEAEPAEAEEG